MELTSKALREAEFREKRGGYHPEDVDRLLEEVADGVDVLNERLRQAVERAQRAEAAASESGGSDETLRRTLVLAQRTADMAVQEARQEASHIVAAAEQQAQALLAEAEERARRAHDEAISDIRSELVSLEAVRQRGQQEVDLLNRWVEEHRAHLTAQLKEALGMMERAGTLSTPPASRPIEVGSRPKAERSGSGGPSNNGPAETTALSGSVGQGVAAWPAANPPRGPQPGGVQFGGPLRQPGEPETNGSEELDEAPQAGAPALDPEEQAIEDFFDADDLDDEEPRFGGRLRRRR